MVQLGYSARFVTAPQFAHAVLSAPSRTEVERVLQLLLRCALLILDEFGYLSVELRLGPALLHQREVLYLRRSSYQMRGKDPATRIRPCTPARRARRPSHRRPHLPLWR